MSAKIAKVKDASGGMNAVGVGIGVGVTISTGESYFSSVQSKERNEKIENIIRMMKKKAPGKEDFIILQLGSITFAPLNSVDLIIA